ncbi:Aste57867_4557 [Aphanomyces stellatus]|uniref:Aste57867_4557 protein n=1 Tax=Aphanomyces stellatus TaxID=120398 RepID=A0A485KE36_9STRA|nr:hypothetical protein As57867_004544 [Aphanomyces stellatus]VFT81663.1 Aste57867_4557 [Aphanomyces stellatus]
MPKVAPGNLPGRKFSSEREVTETGGQRVSALGPLPGSKTKIADVFTQPQQSSRDLAISTGRTGTMHNLRRHTVFRTDATVAPDTTKPTAGAASDAATRRSSMGLATALLYPQTAADRHESTRVTKLMEEKYGFNYLTNEFSANILVENEYQAYYTQIYLVAACNLSLFLWIVWVVMIAGGFILVASAGGQDDSTTMSLLFALPFLVPTPFLVALCRTKRYEQHMQTFISIIIHCFALSFMGAGFFSAANDIRTFTSENMNYITNYATNISQLAATTIGYMATTTNTPLCTSGNWTIATTPGNLTTTTTLGTLAITSANGLNTILLQNLSYAFACASASSCASTVVLNNRVQNGSHVFAFNNLTAQWGFPDRNGTLNDTLTYFFLDVMLPFSTLNAGLIRPIVVLTAAPIFHLNVGHYIVVAFNVNLFYCIIVSVTFPVSSSGFLMRCKFYLVFVLAMLTAIMGYRVRQSDRFMRLNFLSVRSVEEKVRIAQEQKEKFQNENRSLKRMLQAHNVDTPDMLDLDSPMAKVITDLTKIQKNATLDKSLQENLSEIVTLLTKQGHNLFAPDIHEQLTSKSNEVEIDADTKGWATTVLASKSYQRNNNRRSSTQPEEEQGILASINLHPEVQLPDEDVLSKINSMMLLNGWNVDIHEVAEMSQGKPISYVTYVIFERHNLFSSCSVERNVMLNFFWFIDAGYLPNPYHNNCHAADVVNYVEFMLSAVDGGFFMTLLNMQEVFASIVAAAIHDFRHPVL